MKKKFSLLICMIVLMVAVTGCGQEKKISYDKEQVEQACENMFQVIAGGYVSEQDVSNMSDWNQGYLMAQVENQTGIKMKAEDFVTALKGWESSEEEYGTYISHDDYSFKSSASGLTVSAQATFSNRKAELEFTFDKNLELEAFTVNAHFSIGEIMQKAGINTVLGMGTVFLVLIFMSFLISLFKYIPAWAEKKDAKKHGKSQNDETPAAHVTETKGEDEMELVAVIAAAIAAYEGTTTDQFVVRSIKRRKSNKWNR